MSTWEISYVVRNDSMIKKIRVLVVLEDSIDSTNTNKLIRSLGEEMFV